jgi:hypothetical protein
MACPYFYPTERHEAELWPHRRRLPLGDGFRGLCTIGKVEPGDERLRDGCNLGYARQCPNLPAGRMADAVRFGLTLLDDRIDVTYVLERNHCPGETGVLQYDPTAKVWSISHPNRCIQRMAECLVKAISNKQ